MILLFFLIFLTGVVNFLIFYFSSINIWFIILFLPLIFFGLNILFLSIAFVRAKCVNLHKEIKKVKRLHHFLLVQVIELIIIYARVRVKSTGMELLPKEPFLMVSNHLSRFDPMITIVKLKKIKMSFISKPENFKVPVAGGYMYLNGYLSIDRDNPRNAIKTIKKEAENIKNGISVYVNPEGTRSKTGLLLPIKPGAFKIATLSHAPIVVATFKNTRQIHKNFPKKTVVYHDILKVIPYEEYKDLNTHEIAAMVEKIMRDNGIE